MKKKIFLIIQACMILFAASCFTACNDVIKDEADRATKGMSIIPNPMTIGEPVAISGPDFRNATAVVFPGGVTVTEFTRSGDFQLSMPVPTGTTSTGNITVVLPGGNFLIPIEVKIVAASANRAIALDINNENGLYWVGPNDKMEIQGQGLGAVQAIVLPGGVTMDVMDIRKSDTSIEIVIPMGVEKVIARVQLILHDGSILYTANEVDFSGEGYVPPELLPFCGRSFKIWSWNDDVDGDYYGMGDALDDIPDWWTGPSDMGLFTPGEGPGATMTLALSAKGDPKLIKERTDGTVAEGLFKVDMTARYPGWSRVIGKLTTKNVTVLTGRDTKDRPDIYEYWILNLTNTEMTLATQDMGDGYQPDVEGWGQATLWLFKAVGGEIDVTITVPDELKPLVGTGSKVWSWDFDAPPAGFGPWAMGAANSGHPDWWSPDPENYWVGEHEGATMKFSYFGKNNQVLSKEKTVGDAESGSFILDLSTKRDIGSGFKGIGKLETKDITVLTGQDTEDGDSFITKFDILKMTDTELVLAYPVEYDEDDAWRTCTYWYFKAVE